MAYILPQPLIFQDFDLTVAPIQRRLNAFLFGPHAQIFRYAEPDEKVLISLGTYDHIGANVDGDFKTCYAWPSKPVGSRIDGDYTKLFIDDALLRIFSSTNTMIKTASNKIRHPSKNFADNGAFARSAEFLRDVKPGDVVTVTGSDGADSYTLYSYVRDVEGDAIAALIGASVTNDDNAETQSLDTDFEADSENSGDVEITSVNGSAYDGLADGDISEVYTVACIEGSTGGDATTAVLRVTSASGNDDDLSLSPSAFGAPTAIGDRGLTATFNTDGGTDFQVGDTWTITIDQDWDETASESDGTYTCDTDKVYIVEVTKGGTWADEPEITVTTQDGSDFSGPTVITLPISGTTTTTGSPSTIVTVAAAVGNCGVTIAFSGLGLRKGDRFNIEATAEKEGNMRTLVLAHNLDSAIPLDDAGTADLVVKIYIKKDIQVGAHHVLNSGDVNWETSDTEFCVFADVYATDDEWVDGDGSLVPLPVIDDDLAVGTNKMYVEYRAWLAEYVGTVASFSDVDDLATMTGPTIEDNPLKWGLFKALQNNNGQDVFFSGVEDPTDLDAWLAVLELIEDRNDVYNLVPLTYDQDVLDATEGHVDSQSTELEARWRAAFFGLNGVTKKVLVASTLSEDGEVVLATTSDDPSTSGTQYTLLTITSSNAQIETLGVKAGDIARFRYQTDAWGTLTYSEYVVDEVLGEDSVRLATGTASAENTPIVVEFWRNLSKTEQAVEIRGNAKAFDNRRVCAVWFDRTIGGMPVTPNYFVAAALAAEVSGVAPHQGLTRASLTGFDGLAGIGPYFNRSQLDGMAENGVWLVAEDPQSQVIITRHGITTADYTNLKYREEMYRRNVDSISFYFMEVFAPYIGKANATDGIIDILEAEVLAGKEFLRRSGYTALLGGQIIDATISDIRISPVFKDRVVIVLDCQLPFPLNNIECHLVV